MGTTGSTPRKRRHRLAKVPRGEEANNIQLAGLSNNSGGPYGARVGHENAHGRSEDVGRVGRFFLWCLGRRRKEQ
jgi:hypothetical protein